ncbi:TonB-dependent receptor domain-containing protein [Sphingomonas sp. ERG5]|uniref:TonB-dependent receptor domain-containing protein n=1 Tax=Sphingomonas sp. ERG5 TaxID=1381597 RepID=UPI000690725F|nr:TonB-dependent receptor [Sphingomonas sp. ERG5]
MLKTRLLAATALAAGSVLFSAGAFAQETAPSVKPVATTETETPTSEDAIIVTGSRIRRPNLESTVPITSISGDQIFQQGQTNIGDTLNDLPQLRSTFAQQNPGLGIGIAGLNLLDLRGLGSQRTLVLVNGRRHVAADILNNAVSTDINTIPNDLIERVDIVTGGNSAIYGSDAIAGVVNFVLKRDFTGVQVRGSAGVAEKGFGGNQYISAMAGTNFAGGRGNIMVHGEYARQSRVFASDIPSYRSQDGLFVTDIDQGGLVNGSDGIPDRTYIRDVRSTSINRYGLVTINQQKGGSAPCGNGISNGLPGAPNAALPYNCSYVFNQDGTLAAQTGARFGQGILGGITGGNGQTGREDKLLSVLPFMERYNFNALGHFAFSDAAELFFEAKWNRVNALGSNAGPSFIQGTFAQFDARERVRLDNPFLNTAARATIANAILASGCKTSLTGACDPNAVAPTPTNLLTATDIANIANGSYRFVVARQLADSGIRDEKFQRDTYRFVGGLRGTFNEDWNYEFSVNYGKFKERTTTYGYLDRQRFMLSLDAGRNPVTGQIQCRAQFDPASAVPFTQGFDATQIAAQQGRLNSDIAACVPYNPFGGGDNSAAAKYFTYNATHVASQDQLVLSGFVGGDLSQLFELPGGPISFAVGAEYRREKSYYQEDPFVQSGATNAVVIPTFSPKAFQVKEAYGELRIPVVKDLPLFHELTISGAARVAKYQGSTGTVWAYNAGADWAPIQDIRFRGNFSRAVRAPNVSETAFPLVPNFAPQFQDPCRPANIGAGSQYRAANCQADLGALLPALNSLAVYSLPVVSGSNLNLKAETSNSITLGAVIQPRIIPGFSLSVDYYNIKVDNVITSVTAQQIANSCYDLPTLANPFCGLFTRYRGGGTPPFGETPGQILGGSLIQAPLNYAKRVRRGLDFQASYRTQLGPNVRLNSNLIYVHQLTNSNYTDPTRPNFENRILGELGDPVDEFRLDTDLTYKQFTFGYRLRYIGPMWVNNYEDFNSLQGRPPENADYADIQQYPSVFYHDIRFEWNIDNSGGFGKDLRFYAGIDNLLDKDPPLGSTATGANSSIYNFRGRNFYAGFRARF